MNLEQGNELHNSISEEDIRDVLFEAGYATEIIDGVLAAQFTAGSNSPSNSTVDDVSDSELDAENANDALKEIRIKNVNKIVIGTLNINSLASKFDELREIIGKNLDILTIQETKLDSSFPTQQFHLDGFSHPYRLERNRDGGWVLG